jgi:hypothetical protein
LECAAPAIANNTILLGSVETMRTRFYPFECNLAYQSTAKTRQIPISFSVNTERKDGRSNGVRLAKPELQKIAKIIFQIAQFAK